MSIYWYVSRQKVDALLPAFGPHGFNLFKELSLTLKAPFVEAKSSLNPDRSLFLNVEKVENGIKSAAAASDPSEAGSKPFFFFRGRAHRAADSDGYFIVLAEERIALLLAGSPMNAIGAPPKQSDHISPSADPIGAIGRLFDQNSNKDSKDLSEICSYVWATLALPVRDNWEALPEAEGIAVFGATFPAAIGQLRRRKFASIDRVVVGTPIFVRQL